MKEKCILPWNILAITFTNKAANEMKERVNNLIGMDSFGMQISTFHSFGLSIIKKNYEKLGFKKYGTFPDNMKYSDGKYMDAYWMMKKL